MKFNSTRNKYKYTYENSEKNKINNENLQNITIDKKNIIFCKKKLEIILIESKLLNENVNIWKIKYEFEKINDNILSYFLPYIIVTTSDGWKLEENESFYYNYWWTQFNNSDSSTKNTTLTLYALRRVGVYNSIDAPLYLTAKIQVINPKYFDLITNSKI